MKTSIIFIIIFFACSNVTFGQTSIDAFGNKITFTAPYEKVWKLVQETAPGDNVKGSLMFKHLPIAGAKGLPVEPVIALIFEQIKEPIDTIEYSANGLMDQSEKFKLKWNLLGSYPEYSNDKHGVVYKAEYTEHGFLHKIYLCYILNNNVGVQIIADSTDDVFEQVDADMRAFIKSVDIQKTTDLKK